MWVISVWVDSVRMIVVVVVVIPVIMMMVMIMRRLKSANARAERLTQCAIRDIRAGGGCTLPFDVMVVRFLHGADFGLKAQHLRAVFTQYAGRRRRIGKCRMFFAHIRWDRDLFTAIHRQHLGPVRTGSTVGWRVLTSLLNNPLSKGFQHLRMVAQIPCLDELNIRVLSRDLIRKPINTVDQNAGK